MQSRHINWEGLQEFHGHLHLLWVFNTLGLGMGFDAFGIRMRDAMGKRGLWSWLSNKTASYCGQCEIYMVNITHFVLAIYVTQDARPRPMTITHLLTPSCGYCEQTTFVMTPLTLVQTEFGQNPYKDNKERNTRLRSRI